MKKTTNLFVFLVALFACSNEDSNFQKPILDADQLEAQVTDRSDFKTFINSSISNSHALIDMSSVDKQRLSESLNVEMASESHIGIKNIFAANNLSMNAIDNLQSMTNELNMNFNFNQSDLEVIIRKSLEQKAIKDNKEGKTTLIPLGWITCLTMCAVRSVSYAADWKAKGFSDALANAMGNAFYVGCDAGCNYAE